MIRVVAGILADGSCLLVCRRPAGAAHAGKWEFPGGKVEPGESLQQALRRELREELEVEVRVGPVLWRTRHRYPGREPVDLTFFAVSAPREKIRNLVFAEVRWVAAGDLSALDFLEGDRELVTEIDRCGGPPAPAPE